MRFIALVVPVATFACGNSMSIRPGGPLIGTWTDAETSLLSANRAGALRTTPCWAIHFKPIILSDSLTFSDTGVAFDRFTPSSESGVPSAIAGRVSGENIIIGPDTLKPGSDFSVDCPT